MIKSSWLFFVTISHITLSLTGFCYFAGGLRAGYIPSVGLHESCISGSFVGAFGADLRTTRNRFPDPQSCDTRFILRS